MSLLRVSGLSAGYGGGAPVIQDLSLEVQSGEAVVVVGANGAGKTTLLKTVSGLLKPRSGHITFAGEEIGRRPAYWVARRGLTLVPEGRGIFGDQTVRENLALPARARREGRDPAAIARDMDRALDIFPALRGRLDQPGGSLSGGQQQMLAVARGLMARPRLLLLDEPSLGLSPLLVREIFEAIARLRAAGTTFLLVEQMAAQALQLADRAYVLEHGRVTLEGPAASVRESPAVIQAYLGRRGTRSAT
jgi:branched-chain amino acid transport system ATP-binding protein